MNSAGGCCDRNFVCEGGSQVTSDKDNYNKDLYFVYFHFVTYCDL